MGNRAIWIAIGAFLSVLVLGFLLVGPKPPMDNTTQQPLQEESSGQIKEEEDASPDGDVREIVVSAMEYSFFPQRIEVEKGERVRITLRNNGSMPHNLTIEGMGAATNTIVAGQSDSVEFVSSEPGEFTFYCSIGNHRSLGQEGIIEVK